jgi:transposase
LEKLTDQNDPLVKLLQQINWEQFRRILTNAFEREEKGVGGRTPFDYVMMFKILVLQRYYNLSDEQMQFQILDRLSFMRFLGLTLSDSVPDEKTIWLFRENLALNGYLHLTSNYITVRWHVRKQTRTSKRSLKPPDLRCKGICAMARWDG